MIEFIKKYFAHITSTIVAILLGIMYFYPEVESVKTFAIGLFIVYGFMLVISIIMYWLIRLIHTIVVSQSVKIENDLSKILAKSLHDIYTTIGTSNKNKYYTPIVSLIIVFFSGSLGFWVFAILEGYSEFVSIKLKESSKNYLEYVDKNVK